MFSHSSLRLDGACPPLRFRRVAPTGLPVKAVTRLQDRVSSTGVRGVVIRGVPRNLRCAAQIEAPRRKRVGSSARGQGRERPCLPRGCGHEASPLEPARSHRGRCVAARFRGRAESGDRPGGLAAESAPVDSPGVCACVCVCVPQARTCWPNRRGRH